MKLAEAVDCRMSSSDRGTWSAGSRGSSISERSTVKQSGKSNDQDGIPAKGLSERIEPLKGWANTRFSRYRDTPAGGFVAELMLRDKESAGGVAGRAIAFRLFL